MKKLVLLLIGFTVLTVSAQNIIYVNQNATGSDNGTSWTDAYIGFQDALSNLSAGDTIWIAQGTYYPTEDELGSQTPADDKDKVFHLSSNDLYVYGGFTGNETTLSQRNPQTNVVLLSGDLGVLGDYNDNANSILNFNTIPNGLIDGVSISFSGGSSSAILIAGVGNFTFNDCILSHNETSLKGAAVGTGNSNIIFSSCNIHHNTAHEAGSLSLNSASVSIYNCIFHDNSSNAHSGNITFIGGVTPIQIANCLFYNNNAGSISGGALYFYSVAPGCEIFNCSFVNNSAPAGGAIGSNGVNIDIYNSILWSPNSSSEAEEYNGNQNIITVSNSTVKGGYTGGSNILTTYPNFVDTTTYNFMLQSNSTAIDQGDTTGISNLIPVIDLNENSRYVGISIDLGCYEYQTTTSITEQTNQNNLTVYPNPATTKLTIDIQEKIKYILILDITGKTVKTVVPTNNTIDVSNLIKGIYFIQVQTEKGVINSKFIKE